MDTLSNLKRNKLMFTPKKQNNFSATIPLVMFAGAAVGAAVTMLFAPKKGSYVRKMIGEKANDLKSTFGFAPQQDLNEDRPKIATAVNSGNSSRSASMHAIRNKDADAAPLSKTESMINHLKHTKQEVKSSAEPI